MSSWLSVSETTSEHRVQMIIRLAAAPAPAGWVVGVVVVVVVGAVVVVAGFVVVVVVGVVVVVAGFVVVVAGFVVVVVLVVVVLAAGLVVVVVAIAAAVGAVVVVADGAGADGGVHAATTSAPTVRPSTAPAHRRRVRRDPALRMQCHRHRADPA